METMNAFCIFFISLILIRAIAEYSEKFLSSRLGELLVKHLRDMLFREQLGWEEDKFRNKHFGNYLLRYSNDMKAVQSYLSKGWLGGIRELIFLLMGFGFLILINGALSGFYALVFVIVLIIFFLLSRSQRPLIIASRGKRSSLLAYVTRSFQRHRKITAESGQDAVLEKFDIRSKDLFDANMANHRFESVFQSLLPLFQYAMIGAILIAMEGHHFFSISSGHALVFVLIMLQMNGALKRLLKAIPALNKGRISMNKIAEIMTGAAEKS